MALFSFCKSLTMESMASTLPNLVLLLCSLLFDVLLADTLVSIVTFLKLAINITSLIRSPVSSEY